jgi:nitrogenase subunit NifH
VYDFSDGPGDLSVTRLEGEEWVETVKWYLVRWNVSLGEVVKNKEIVEDFAIGGSTNPVQRVSVVMNGEGPVATAATQVCAKSQRAADYMAARLVGVICMS